MVWIHSLEHGRLLVAASLKKTDFPFPRTHYLSTASLLGVRDHEPFLLPSWNVDWLGIVQEHTAAVCFSGSVSSVVLPCPKDVVLLWSSATSGSYSLSSLSSVMLSEYLDGNDIGFPVLVEYTTNAYILYPEQLFELLSFHTKVGGM